VRQNEHVYPINNQIWDRLLEQRFRSEVVFAEMFAKHNQADQESAKYVRLTKVCSSRDDREEKWCSERPKKRMV